MPNIVIVDDESIFRKGLRKIIAELDSDWNIVGEAKDGYEALQLIEELQPDAILTDIRMPRMNGIQLQQLTRERFPNLLCVVISGYDDFSYVQQSMRQGASDYMMKPIEREELSKVLVMLKEKLAQQQTIMKQKSYREENQIHQHVSEYLVTGLLRGTANPGDLELLKSIGIEFKWPFFTCMVIKLDKNSVANERYNQADPSLFQLYIQQLVQEIINRRVQGHCFIMSETEVAALLNIPNSLKAMLDIVELGETIRRQVTTLSNMTVTIGLGGAKEGMQGISSAYGEAEIALLHRLIIGGDKVIVYSETAKDERFTIEMIAGIWDRLTKAINEGQCELVEQTTAVFVSELCRYARTPETVHQQMCKLLIHYYEWAGKIGIIKEWLGTKDMKTVLLDICSLSSREELIEQSGQLLIRLTKCMLARKVQLDQEQDPIEKSIQYMEKHYAEPLNLKEVADSIYLSAAYFSTLFKQKTGKSFIERLSEMRIAEAKQRMLHSDEKLAVIAEQTGFSNVRHFNRVFRSVTGMSPSQYRDRYGHALETT